jgi:hypothetical protein
MANLARLSGSDLGSATRSAITKSHLYISRGHSTLENTWLRPALQRKGLQHVLFTAEDHGLVVPSWLRETPDANALNQVVKQEHWQKCLTQPVQVRRVWGATGLLWALLLDQFGAQRSFQVCRRCERINPARPANNSAVPPIAVNALELDGLWTSVARDQAACAQANREVNRDHLNPCCCDPIR